MLLSFDCFQSEPLSCLPTSLCGCGPLVDSGVTHCSVDSSAPSSSSDGRAEHRDGRIPMVTSALFVCFLSQGSVWQPSIEASSSEEFIASMEAGIGPEPESRQNETSESVVPSSSCLSEEGEIERDDKEFAMRMQ
jgi:hypothetical protein